MNKKLFLFSAFTLLIAGKVSAQNVPAMCRNSEMMDAFYAAHPEAREKVQKEADDEIKTKRKQSARTELQDDKDFKKSVIAGGANAKSSAVDTYRVAVVFHVYGTNQGGFMVTDTLIKGALAKLNDDFHGLNPDYNQVHSQFMSVRSKKNIKFYLAKKDPNGNPTTGIIYYPTTYGYGNGSGYDAQVQADAWDNYKYINVYVQHDLYNDGATNNSGVAWYPNTWMSDNGLARIVYNGAYLHTNTDVEFSSVLTHEFGHFFDLIHTFDGGCTTPNDYVSDTPPCTVAQGCHTNTTTMQPLNCNNQLVNSDNYMDYNICYKMFTQGQADRMDDALYMPSRVTLWQDSTLISTGIYNPVSVLAIEEENIFNIYPNTTNGLVNIETTFNKMYNVEITNSIGKLVYSNKVKESKLLVDLSDKSKGVYYVTIYENGKRHISKVILQ